jgi:hypothetical protein
MGVQPTANQQVTGGGGGGGVGAAAGVTDVVEEFWALCDPTLDHFAGANYDAARALWHQALVEGRAATLLAAARGHDHRGFAFALSQAEDDDWEVRFRWLASLRAEDGSRIDFDPEFLLEVTLEDDLRAEFVPGVVVAVADGEGHHWSSHGLELRRRALALVHDTNH